MPFTIQHIYRPIWKIWRKRRFDLFLRLLSPRPTDTLVDVGGYPSSWTSHPQCVARIDVLNVDEVLPTTTQTPEYNIQRLRADGCALPMADSSYDIGFSNSVIEHVGSWERQQEFAAEIRRVAKRLWVQTPAFECPIEPHYLSPIVHYLPRWLQKSTVRWCTPWGWIERPNRDQINSMVDSTRLLRKSEMRRLFPDCEIVTERIFWFLPKSYIAFRTSEQATA
jgi:hypothetical protein